MFAVPIAAGKEAPGAQIASKLADHAAFKSHSRFIGRDQARDFGLEVDDLEKDNDLQNDTLSLFHCVAHTFNATPCVKIIENHLGKAFLKQQQPIFLGPQQGPGPMPMPPQPPPGPA